MGALTDDYTVYWLPGDESSWTGKEVERTVGSVVRTALLPTFTPVPVRPVEKRMTDGHYASQNEYHSDAITGELWVRGTYNGASADPQVIHRHLADDWLELGEEFNPHDGKGTLRVDRVDNGGSSTSRVMLCEVLELPSLHVHTDGPDTPGIFARGVGTDTGGGDGPHFLYVVKLRAPDPYWADRTADTQAFSVGASPDANALTHDGVVDVPFKIDISSVSGTVTVIDLEDPDGNTVTITHSTGFQNSDVIDFGYTTSHKFSTTTASGTISVGVGEEDFAILAGGGTYTATRTTGTGTLTATLTWAPKYASW